MERMYTFWREFDLRVATMPKKPKGLGSQQRAKWLDGVFHFAAWVQHQIAVIHPFYEGNGRMARIMTNLILRRYGLQPSRLKYEGEDKKEYLRALCQIDYHQDYELLKKLIAESVYSTYRKIEEAHRKARE